MSQGGLDSTSFILFLQPISSDVKRAAKTLKISLKKMFFSHKKLFLTIKNPL